MIILTGLNTQQKTLCDIIWACDSQDQVTSFIGGLPAAYRKDAIAMRDLMTAAVFDDVAEIQQSTVDLIDSFR